jgi:hypothetical protein
VRGRAARAGAAALAAALSALASPRPAGASVEEATTEHVLVRGDLPKEALLAFARLAESCWPEWKEYFGATPPKARLPLVAEIAADRDSFLRAVRDAGGPSDLPGAGGYTWTGTGTSYLYPQPHESSTRLLLLHELTHQFQQKAVQDGRGDRSPEWHREGLAEHFGFHRRTADGLVVGALDVAAIDDRPDRCAALAREGKIDLWKIGTGAHGPVDYDHALAAVETFLRTKDEGLRKAYRAWEKEVHRGSPPESRFEKAFRGKEERLAKAVQEVWGSFRRPWTVVYVAWDEEPGAIVGRGSRPVLRGNLPASRVRAAVELSAGAEGAELALAMKGPAEYLGLSLEPDGALHLFRRGPGRAEDLGSVPADAPALGRAVRLSLVLQGPEAVVERDGLPVLRAPHGIPAPGGGAGLVVRGGEARFRSVEVSP